jgi:hypothetical protein
LCLQSETEETFTNDNLCGPLSPHSRTGLADFVLPLTSLKKLLAAKKRRRRKKERDSCIDFALFASFCGHEYAFSEHSFQSGLLCLQSEIDETFANDRLGDPRTKITPLHLFSAQSTVVEIISYGTDPFGLR